MTVGRGTVIAFKLVVMLSRLCPAFLAGKKAGGCVGASPHAEAGIIAPLVILRESAETAAPRKVIPLYQLASNNPRDCDLTNEA